MLLPLFLFCFQGHYYIDGTEIHLDDGTVIKTSAEVKLERLFYTWVEEGFPVSVSRDNVRSIQYFSMRVEGEPPLKTVRTIVQRRISGRPVLYQSQGKQFLKHRHVDTRGRSAEGRAPNILKTLSVGETAPGSAYRPLEADFSKTMPGTTVTFRFYDLTGKLQCQAFAMIQKKRGKDSMRYSLQIPTAVAVEGLGLVEVITEQ
jgi:hypothetical protein